jgi:toxin ParE1/3/4
MRGFVLAVKAKADLKEIGRYTQTQWGREQRFKYIGQLYACFEELAEKPTKGKDYSYVREGYFGQAVGSHLVFYRQTRTRIEIIRILHQSMDIEGRLTEP